MQLNRTFELKVMTILISRELPLFNFESLDILCVLIRLLYKKLWPFEFLESLRSSISSVSIYYVAEPDIRVKSYDHLNFPRVFIVQFRASHYIILKYRAFVCNVMTIGISRELTLFNFERLDIWCAWIGHPSEKFEPLEFLKSFCCSISSVSTYYAPELDIRVKRYDQINFSRTLVV